MKARRPTPAACKWTTRVRELLLKWLLQHCQLVPQMARVVVRQHSWLSCLNAHTGGPIFISVVPNVVLGGSWLTRPLIGFNCSRVPRSKARGVTFQNRPTRVPIDNASRHDLRQACNPGAVESLRTAGICMCVRCRGVQKFSCPSQAHAKTSNFRGAGADNDACVG